MSLSTAQPSLGGAPPTLGEHTIKFAADPFFLSTKRQRRQEREYYGDQLIASCSSIPDALNRRERRLSIRMAHYRSKQRDDDSGSDSDHEIPAVEVETAKVHSLSKGVHVGQDGLKHIHSQFSPYVELLGDNCTHIWQ